MIYVDNILAIYINATKILKSLEGDYVKYNNSNIVPPDMYMESNIQEKYINNIDCWNITSIYYINAAINTVE